MRRCSMDGVYRQRPRYRSDPDRWSSGSVGAYYVGWKRLSHTLSLALSLLCLDANIVLNLYWISGFLRS